MKNVAAACAAMVLLGCMTERIEIVREPVGCMSDAMCDDRDPETADWCETDSGFCNHERSVEAGLCAGDADCDDGDDGTTDACTGGDCHHTREYDPREHQDHRAYCIAPATYCDPGEAPGAHMPFDRCSGVREAWRETGYQLLVTFRGLAEEGTMLVLRPTLLAGDPDDVFRVRLETDMSGDGWPDEAVLVRDLTAREIERDGLAIALSRPAVPGSPLDASSAMFRFVVSFADPATYRSRAMQWAFLPGNDITDAESGADYVPCPLVGEYVDVPEHGLLRLTEDAGGGPPRCEGVVRGIETWWGDDPSRPASGLFRTESDATLRYASDLAVPQQLIEFRSMREFVDWFRHPLDQWHPSTVCALASVIPDAALERSRAAAETRQVGARPGTLVTWTDPLTRERRYGVADRRWTLHDVGTDEWVLHSAWSGVTCTAYGYFTGGGSTNCFLDLGWLSGYTVSPTDPATIDPVRIDAESGWLLGYHRDP